MVVLLIAVSPLVIHVDALGRDVLALAVAVLHLRLTLNLHLHRLLLPLLLMLLDPVIGGHHALDAQALHFLDESLSAFVAMFAAVYASPLAPPCPPCALRG